MVEAAVEAARRGATVGEMSAALERVFGRHAAEAHAVSGRYAREAEPDDPALLQLIEMSREFERNEGRPPTILVAKLGQDGHDRGQKVIGSAFGDFGFSVELGQLFATPEETAREAVAKNVHVVGVSTLAAGHLTLVPERIEALQAAGRGDIMVVVGGVVPPQDHDALKNAGVAAIYTPGTPLPEAARDLLDRLNRKLGYAQRTAE